MEREGDIGTQTSSRNSEVIHAGIYYEPSSLKAKLCIKGKRLLYKYCEDNKIPFLNCGKWIVGKSVEDEEKIGRIYHQANLCGVNDLYYLSIEEAKSIEKNLNATKVLVSPSSGIFDSHTFINQLKNDFEEARGTLALKTTCNRIEDLSPGFLLSVSGDQYDDFQISSKNLINAAGLDAINVASKIPHLEEINLPKLCLAKGTYYKLYGKQPFSRLVYPIPENGGLGIHYTIDLQGYGKFGPDVEWINDVDYSINNKNKTKFVKK